MNKLKQLPWLFVLGAVAGWRVFLFLLAGFADRFLPYQPSFPYALERLASSGLPRWLYSWGNFDGVHYITIAELGYGFANLTQAFFPIYPLLIRAGMWLGLSGVSAGLLLSHVSLVAGLLCWYSWLKQAHNQATAKVGVVVLLLWPVSFFWGSVYTESLFWLLSCVALWAGSQKQWWWAGLATALASATRVVGIFLIPALLLEWWLQPRKNRRVKDLVPVALGAVGLLSYMYYLYVSYGDPLYFFHVQSEFGGGRQESLILYPQVVWRYLKILLTVEFKSLVFYAAAQEFLAGTAGLALLVVAYKKVPRSVWLFSLLTFFLPTFTGTFASLPRYLMACPALFWWLALQLSTRPWIRRAWWVIATVWLVFNTILFIQGYWVA